MQEGGATRSGSRFRQSVARTTVTRRIRTKTVEEAVGRFRDATDSVFCAEDPDHTPPTAPVRVASNVTPSCAFKFFGSMAGKLATFGYYEATRDLVVVKMSPSQRSCAHAGLWTAIEPFLREHCAFIRRMGQSDTVVFTTPRSLVKPDYVISPRGPPPGQPDSQPPHRVASPRVVIEIEYNARGVRELHAWASRLLGDPLIRAVIAIFVYNRYKDGTFAMLAVLFQRGSAGEDASAAAWDLVSFGTRALHQDVMAAINDLPLAPGARLRELPLPPIAVLHRATSPMPAVWNGTNHFITVSGKDVFWQAPTPAVDPLPDLAIDLWPILSEVASLYDWE